MKRHDTDPTSGELHLAPLPLEATDPAASELLQEVNREYQAHLDEPEAWNRLSPGLQARSRRPTRPLYWAYGVAAAAAALLLLAPASFKSRFFDGRAAISARIDPTSPTSSGDVPSKPIAADATPTDVTPTILPQPLAQGRTRLADGSVVHLSTASDAAVSTAVGTLGSNRTTIDLSRGTVELHVAHRIAGHQLEVVSGTYRFVALGTRFRVRMAPGRVDLDVSEGTVGVMTGAKMVARIESGRSWSGSGSTEGAAAGGASTAENPRPADPPIASPRSHAEAVETADEPDCAAAARAGRTREAIGCYQQQASRDGMSAELAMYEIARLRKDVLSDFAGALDVLRGYQARFPRGSLRGEVEVSALELLERLGRNDEVLSESKRLLATPYGKERASAIHFLRGNVFRRAFHDFAQAEAEYAAISSEPGSQGDEAQPLRADCLERMGRPLAAAGVYREYLRRPHARHAAEAKARLSTLSP